MRIQRLDEEYLEWLYSQVADPNEQDPSLTYWKVLRYLFTEEFEWRIPNDDNRLEDGKDLRREFIADKQLQGVPADWVEMCCSVLELMVGLARRMSFEAEGEPHYWFWCLMENIRLRKYCDTWTLQTDVIDHILKRLMLRTYKSNGQGGFFPLRHPDQDQRNVELWYQLSAYVLELEEC